MIQVFDTHRLPYRNAVIRAFKLKSDNLTEPAEFYNFTDYVKDKDDVSKYAIGTEVYTNASGYICYGTDRQQVSCLGVNESVVVRVSLDGGLSWKIGWTLHGGDDTLTTDDFGRLLYADGTVCFDPLRLGDTTLRDFVTTDAIDPNNRWEEDTILLNDYLDSVTLTDWTRIIVIPNGFTSKILRVSGHCRAGQCVEVINEAPPSESNPTLTVKFVETNETYEVPRGLNFRLLGYDGGGIGLMRTGNFPVYRGQATMRKSGWYSFGNGQVGSGINTPVLYDGLNAIVANGSYGSNDAGTVTVKFRGGHNATVPAGHYLVVDGKYPLKPATVTESLDVAVGTGTTKSVVVDFPKLVGKSSLPDVLEVSVNVKSSATLSNRTRVYLSLPHDSENWVDTTFVVKLVASGVPSGNARTLEVILGTTDLKYHLVGTSTGTLTDVGDFSAVVASHVRAIGGGLLAHAQLSVTDGVS